MRVVDDGTKTDGVLYAPGYRAMTLEPPWKDNQDDVSCIPPGTYAVEPFDSPDHPDTFQIMGVPDRDDILIHIGNVWGDTNGCILAGTGYGRVLGDDGITGSEKAICKLRDIIEYPTNICIQDVNMPPPA